MPPSPTHFGPFEVVSRLGRGGMGTVYRGVHAKSRLPVAIKMLAEPLADDENFRQRFNKEIEALRQLRHPNIVRLLGYGQEDDSYYYVMELVDGHSLEDELRTGRRFTWRETLVMGIQIASALNCAHNHGIIHRDLKPANLMLSLAGTIKLSDFGIATLFGSSKITSIGSVIGTLSYMAPEQALGLPISARSDLFSFGAVLTALLTGQPPFKGSTLPEVLHLHATAAARRPSQLGVEIPVEFDELIGRLLEREPENRPKNAYFVQRVLEAIQEETGLETGNSTRNGTSTGNSSIVVPLSTDVLQQKLRERKNTVKEESQINHEPESQEPSDFRNSESAGTRLEDAKAGQKTKINIHKELSLELEVPLVKSQSYKASSSSIQAPETNSQQKSTNEHWAGESGISSSKVQEKGNVTPQNLGSTDASSESASNQTVSTFDDAVSGEKNSRLEKEIPPETFQTKTGTGNKESRRNYNSDASDSRSFFREENYEEPHESASESQWAAIVMVLLLSGLCFFFAARMIRAWSAPPTADVLYDEIIADSEKDVYTERFSKNVEIFLACYSNDPRARKVQEFQTEILLDRLEKRLFLNSRGTKFRSVPPIERDYLNAVRTLQTQPEITLKNLEDFINFYEASCESMKRKENFSQEELLKNMQYLEVARRQIFRIRQILETERKERRSILQEEVAYTLELLNSDEPEQVERGKKLKDAALNLYKKREPDLVAPLDSI